MYSRYNLETGQVEGRVLATRYSVDGRAANLPAPLVELELIEAERPSVPTGKALRRTETVDLKGQRLVRGWELVDLPAEVLRAQRQASVRTEARAIFGGLPVKTRAAFAGRFVAVSAFLDLGDWEGAVQIILDQAVPEGLEETKAALVAKLQEGVSS